MSKISLTGNASGSGSVILQAPNSSTNRTLTVSEVSGNIAISDGSTLTVDYASNRTTIGGKADFYGASTVKLDKCVLPWEKSTEPVAIKVYLPPCWSDG